MAQIDSDSETKKKQLITLALAILPEELESKETIASMIVEKFCNIQKHDNDIDVRLISLNSKGIGGGYSRKPGNIVLDWERLFSLVPNVVITGSSVSAGQWIIPFAALHIVSTVWRAAKVDLSPEHAVVLYAIWQNKDSKKQIAEEKAFEVSNREIKAIGRPEISRVYFNVIINHLCSIGCITLVDGLVRMRERIRTSYRVT